MSESGPKSEPKVDPFWGGRMSENTMKTKGFGPKSALQGVNFRLLFGPKSGTVELLYVTAKQETILNIK